MLIGHKNIADYRIIHVADILEGEADAIAVLCETVYKATGCTLPVFTDEAAPADGEIVIGKTNRDTEAVVAARAAIKNDGYAMLMEGERLFITANLPRGNVYGVYTFMEDYLGARFYADTYSVVHENATANLPADLYRVDSPHFFSRDTFWYQILYPRRPTRMNIHNALKCNHGGMRDLDGGVLYAGSFVHTIGSLAEEPSHDGSQPCLTEEAVFEKVRKNVRRWLDDNPQASIISVSQNDTGDAGHGCQCARCKAIDDAEGTPMGSLLTFVNRIADDIKEDYPHVYVDTLAYRYSRKAPKTIVPRDNVIIRLCSIECCFAHPLDDPDCPCNVAFVEDIRKWASICNNLYIWDYTTNFSAYLAPFPNFNVLRQNVKFFKDHHVIGLFEQGNYQSLSGEFGELRGYLLAKLLWDPDMSAPTYEAHMEEFLRDYYGKGWRYIRQYIDLTTAKAAERHLSIYDHTSKIFPFADKAAETAFAEQLLALWDSAYAAADDDAHRAHVAQSRVQALYYAEYVLPDERFAALNKQMVDAMREAGITKVRECDAPIDWSDPTAYPDFR